MLRAIHNATKHLCTDTLGLQLTRGKSLGKGFYGASIPLITNKKEAHYYLFLKRDTLNTFGSILMLVDTLDEDELGDLCKEVANLIVGTAKRNLSDANPKDNYKLGTPEYLGKVSPPFPIKLDDQQIFKLKNRTFVLGVKIANG